MNITHLYKIEALSFKISTITPLSKLLHIKDHIKFEQKTASFQLSHQEAENHDQMTAEERYNINGVQLT